MALTETNCDPMASDSPEGLHSKNTFALYTSVSLSKLGSTLAWLSSEQALVAMAPSLASELASILVSLTTYDRLATPSWPVTSKVSSVSPTGRLLVKDPEPDLTTPSGSE